MVPQTSSVYLIENSTVQHQTRFFLKSISSSFFFLRCHTSSAEVDNLASWEDHWRCCGSSLILVSTLFITPSVIVDNNTRTERTQYSFHDIFFARKHNFSKIIISILSLPRAKKLHTNNYYVVFNVRCVHSTLLIHSPNGHSSSCFIFGGEFPEISLLMEFARNCSQTTKSWNSFCTRYTIETRLWAHCTRLEWAVCK